MMVILITHIDGAKRKASQLNYFQSCWLKNKLKASRRSFSKIVV